MTGTRILCIAASLALLVTGCAGESKPSGFLSTYDNLQTVSPTLRRYVSSGNEMGKYSKFVVDPIETRFSGNQAKIDPKDEQHLKQYMYLAVREQLAPKYALVSDAGDGVARIRIAITNLTAAAPAVQMTPQSKLAGIGAGKASVEIELVDSQTGRQLAAAIDSASGNPYSIARHSEWGQVEELMTAWAKRLAQRIDEVHAQTK